MGNNTISQKIDAYAQANLKALKQEEAKTGRKMTKFDIAQYMLQHGKLNKNEYANWMNTSEGFNAQAMTQAQKTALRQGSVWGFAGYGGGQESYLDSMTSFSQKTPIERQNTISGHQMKLNETVAERKKKAAEMNNYIKNQRVLNYKKTAEEQKLKARIDKLPTPTETYTELINDLKFQKMDRGEKIKFLMETTGKKAYEARERGDKEAAKEYLMQGMSYVFAYMDEKIGINDIKEPCKQIGRFISDYVDKFVDDGDDANLSLGERAWEATKGAADAVDSFIGTQGAAMMGTLAIASEAAVTAGIGKLFAIATQGYFAFEGTGLVIDGSEKIYNAETKEEARVGGQEFTTGGIMVGGAVKSVKGGEKNVKHQKKNVQQKNENTKSESISENTQQNETPQNINKSTINKDIETTSKPSAKIVKMEPKIKQTKQNNTDNKSKALTPKEAETKATLDKAGFTEDVINQMIKDTQGGGFLVPSTLKLVEYLENRIAKGEKLSPQMIHEAIQNCDGVYRQPGYGSDFQEIQKELLGKYWNRAGELKEAYRKEGRFLTEKDAVQYKEAKTKATLDKAGFSEDVINQMRKDTQGRYGDLVPSTLKMVEYLENRIAKGEKLSPQMIHEAIQNCDGVYRQPGYGSDFQEIQKELLGKYWNRAGELKEAYRKEGRFLTEKDAVQYKEAKTKATLDKAGFSEDVINQMRKDTQGRYGDLVPSTLKMVEYLENRIAKGEKLSPQMIHEAIQNCDGVYRQPGYGSDFQEIQKELLGKYWNRAGELKEAYRKEGRFLTEKDAVQYKEAKTKATLDKAGFSEDVINQMRKDTQGRYGDLVPSTLKMVEYLENRIAKGEKLSPQMIHDAIQNCDGVYRQPGYGSKFQETQKELLGKYWNRAGELKEAFRTE